MNGNRSGRKVALPDTVRAQFLALVEDLHTQVTVHGAFVKEYWRAAYEAKLYRGAYSTFRRAYNDWKKDRAGTRRGRGSYAGGAAIQASAPQLDSNGLPKAQFGPQRKRTQDD